MDSVSPFCPPSSLWQPHFHPIRGPLNTSGAGVDKLGKPDKFGTGAIATNLGVGHEADWGQSIRPMG